MKRYDFLKSGGDPVESEHGVWTPYTDAVREVQKLRRLLGESFQRGDNVRIGLPGWR